MGTGRSKLFSTTTNVADEREYYAFHPSDPFIGKVQWRVRAVRRADITATNKLPTVSYGPWSPVYTSTNSPFQTGVFSGLSTLAEPATDAHDPAKDGYALTPGFVFSGDSGFGAPAELYRVYIFSDQDCINPVFKGSLIGSPAYAPRTSGPLALPTDPQKFFKLLYPWDADTATTISAPITPPDGAQATFSVDNGPVDEREAQPPATFTPTLVGASTPSDSSSSSPGSSGHGSTAPSLTGWGAPVGLWDTNWPVGRYYWTVVAAHYVIVGGDSPHVDYWDDEVPQDVCNGRYAEFGMASQPAIAANPANKLPYAWGLTTKGRLGAATTKRPTFAGAPLVAWQPAVGATAYELQVSKSAYPWRTYGNLYTFSTSTTLPLPPGKWWYRVRGIDLTLPKGASTMAWSQKIGLVIARPKFAVGK
jgi:hypothetical protein